MYSLGTLSSSPFIIPVFSPLWRHILRRRSHYTIGNMMFVVKPGYHLVLAYLSGIYLIFGTGWIIVFAIINRRRQCAVATMPPPPPPTAGMYLLSLTYFLPVTYFSRPVLRPLGTPSQSHPVSRAEIPGISDRDTRYLQQTHPVSSAESPSISVRLTGCLKPGAREGHALRFRLLHLHAQEERGRCTTPAGSLPVSFSNCSNWGKTPEPHVSFCERTPLFSDLSRSQLCPHCYPDTSTKEWSTRQMTMATVWAATIHPPMCGRHQ